MKSIGMTGQRDRTSVVRVLCPHCREPMATLYPEERPAKGGEPSASRSIVCPHCNEPSVIHTTTRTKT